jgi:hypothetical protein
MRRRMQIISLAAGSCLAVAAAAGGKPERLSYAEGQLIVDSFRKSLKVAFEECSDHACVKAAMNGCRSVHFFDAFYTLEGSVAFADYFVVGSARACRVIVFGDYSTDYWGACRISKRTCTDMASADAGDPARCTPTEILWQAKVCPNPLQR